MKNKPLNPIYPYIIVALTITSIVVCMVLKQPILYAFLVILGCTFVFTFNLGYSVKALFLMMYSGMLKVKVVIIMLSLMGIMISLWMLHGTIPALIYYGFVFLADTNIVLSAFLISTIISMVIGTAIGTLSIVAPVFIGLAIGLNVPLPLIVGALVSGAYLGDRTSPVSSSVNLTALVTDSNILENVKNMLITLIPAFILSVVLYKTIGVQFIPDKSSHIIIENIKILIQNEFTLDVVVFIPLAILLITMIILKKTIIKGISYSLIATVLLLVLISKVDLLVIIKTALMGYAPSNIEIERLVSGSGLISMFDIFYIILISTAFNGILEGTQLIKPMLDVFKTGIKSPTHLMHRSGLLSVLVTTLTCNQTLTAIITGNTFKELYKKNNISTTYLARSISDFGMIMVPIIPWNVNAILVKSLTGVSAIQYTPLSFFPLLLPLVGFFYPYILNRKLKLNTQADDSTVKNIN